MAERATLYKNSDGEVDYEKGNQRYTERTVLRHLVKERRNSIKGFDKAMRELVDDGCIRVLMNTSLGPIYDYIHSNQSSPGFFND